MFPVYVIKVCVVVEVLLHSFLSLALDCDTILAIYPDRCTLEEVVALSTYWTGGRMKIITGLDVSAKRKMSLSLL